tara:strand:+ start:784 stop:1095 length:312 start_codon:yes stop_codon:yes gene_type:complete
LKNLKNYFENNKRMDHKKEITMLHEVVNTYKEENEKLKKKIEELEDGENTLIMIDNLNKEFDDLQEDLDKFIEKMETCISPMFNTVYSDLVFAIRKAREKFNS